MAIATGTAIALGIGAATKAATDIYGAKKQGDAAERAAQQQIAAAERAKAEMKPLYDQALGIAAAQHAQGRADLSPYAQAGAGAVGTLSDFLGVPRAAAPAAVAAPPSAPPPTTPLSQIAMTTLPNGAKIPANWTQYWNDVAAGRIPDPTKRGSAGQPAAPSAPSGAATVLLRAPNGQTQAVAPEQVDFFLARGATRA